MRQISCISFLCSLTSLSKCAVGQLFWNPKPIIHLSNQHAYLNPLLHHRGHPLHRGLLPNVWLHPTIQQYQNIHYELYPFDLPRKGQRSSLRWALPTPREQRIQRGFHSRWNSDEFFIQRPMGSIQLLFAVYTSRCFCNPGTGTCEG